MSPFPDQRPLDRPAPAPLLAALLVVALFAACAWPLIFTENLLGRAAFDQLHYHEPAVRTFAAQWPSPDLRDYRSATTPGYHLILAAVCRFITGSGMWLQFLSSLFTLSLLGLFASASAQSAAAAGRRHPAALAMLLSLPPLTSIYVFFPGVWLLPDNLGWLLVLGVALLSWRIAVRGLSIASFLAAAALMAALVLVRQSHIWAAGLLWIGAWLGAAPIGEGGVMEVLSRPAARLCAITFALVATIPAVLALLYFRGLWKGLTPPMFADQYSQSWNPAAPAFILTLLAVFSAFFAGYIADAGWRIAVRKPAGLVALMALAALTAAIPETTYIHEERSTGLWNLVRAAPVIADHTSIILLIGAPLGAWAVWAWFDSLAPRARWLFLVSLAAFSAAQTFNPICWQRYIEPLLLIVVGLAAAGIPPARAPGTARGLDRLLLHLSPPARVAGPFVLSVLFSFLVLRSLLNADIPWNTEVGPDGRRRVTGGVLVIPGVPMEEQEPQALRPAQDLPPMPSEPAPSDR